MEKFKPNQNLFYYLYFIQERMNIFWKRFNGESFPFTDDKILSENKFTNTYRVLDRSSQYLLREVIYNEKGLNKGYSAVDLFWRILIYKHFNLPFTWDLLIKEFKDIDTSLDIEEIILFLKSYKGENKLYSPAYLSTTAFMKSESSKIKYGLFSGMPKFELYFKIFKRDFLDDGILNKVIESKSYLEVFNLLKTVMGFADFLSYQIAQDFNYTYVFDFDDNSFCSAGGGTINGIHRCFEIEGKPDYEEIVKWICSNYDELVSDYSKKFDFDLSCKMIDGWGMKVPDFSNCFCESDKYMRKLGIKSEGVEGSHMRSKFNACSSKINFIFPTKWNIKI